MADRGTGVKTDSQRSGTGGNTVRDQHRAIANRIADVVVDQLLARHVFRHVQDVIAVQCGDASAALDAAAIVAVIDRSVHHNDGIRDTAVAESARIVKAASVDAGYAVEMLDFTMNTPDEAETAEEVAADDD